MRIITTSLVAAACLFSVPGIEAHGGGCSNIRSRAVSVIASRQFVVQASVQFVPFAIPVAVPVAVVNTPSVVYGYSGYSAAYRAQPSQAAVRPRDSSFDPEALDGRQVEEPGAKEVTALSAADVVTRRCTKCHGGDEPKAGFSLEAVNVSELDRDTRYSMLRRIMEPDQRKRMPKGGELSREEFDALVNSLVR